MRRTRAARGCTRPPFSSVPEVLGTLSAGSPGGAVAACHEATPYRSPSGSPCSDRTRYRLPVCCCQPACLPRRTRSRPAAAGKRSRLSSLADGAIFSSRRRKCACASPPPPRPSPRWTSPPLVSWSVSRAPLSSRRPPALLARIGREGCGAGHEGRGDWLGRVSPAPGMIDAAAR